MPGFVRVPPERLQPPHELVLPKRVMKGITTLRALSPHWIKNRVRGAKRSLNFDSRIHQWEVSSISSSNSFFFSISHLDFLESIRALENIEKEAKTRYSKKKNKFLFLSNPKILLLFLGQEVDSEISNQLVGLMVSISIEDDTRDLSFFLNSPVRPDAKAYLTYWSEED